MDTEIDPKMDYQRRFGGIARLYGEHGLLAFEKASVCVIGIGGVGSWAAEALARSAVGRITLIDLDNVAESNVNRQIHAASNQIGRPKIEVMAERICGINPECVVTLHETFVEPDNLQELIGDEFNYVIDCIDTYRTKASLIAYCRRHRIKVITVGGAGGQVDPQKIRIADLSRTQHDPLLAKTRKLLRKSFNFPVNPKRRFDIPCVYSDEQQVYPTGDGGVCRTKPETGVAGGLQCGGFGSAMTVTATFGLVATAHVLGKLAQDSRKL